MRHVENLARRAAAFAVLAVSTCLLPGRLRADDQAPFVFDAKTRVAIAEKINETVIQHFGLWDDARRAAYASAWASYRAQVASLSDRWAFDRASMALLSTLRNGHTGFYDEEPVYIVHNWIGPIAVRYVENVFVVKRSAVDGVHVGDTIAAVDGVPSEPYFQAHRSYFGRSSELETRGQFMQMVGFDHPDGATFTLANGQQVYVANREVDTPAPAASPSAPAVSTPYRWITPNSVGYISISGFDDPIYEKDAINVIHAQFMHAKALIVDVRGNGGGDTPVKLMKLLMQRPWSWWHETSNALQPARKPVAFMEDVVADRYTGRVVILTDRNCGSSCEDFVQPFLTTHSATVVGEPTYGSTGQPFYLQLGGGLSMRVGSIDTHLPDGSPFEGVGLRPDVIVPYTIEEIRNGRDDQLAAAIKIAQAP
jgi:carboxyl-terminal processing protease